MRKPIHLAAQFPDADFGALAHIARTAERGVFDFVLLAEESRLQALTVLAALAGVTERIGLAAAINPTFHEPYELARQLATLDHLAGGRAAWNVLTSWDAHAGENFRRGGYLPREQRHDRAAAFVRTVGELLGSWRPGDVVADKVSGVFLQHPHPGAFAHRDGHFDIAGRFNVPRSPQDRPLIIHAGDSDDDREFAACCADVSVSRHRTPSAGRAFYSDAKSRLARYGRRRDELLILLELSEQLSFAGSADTVAAALDEFVRAGACDGFLLVPHANADLDVFVDQVVPLLQQRGVFRSDYEGTTLREHLGLGAVDEVAVRAAS